MTEAEYLRAGIQYVLDGTYSTVRKNALCPHGRYGWEECTDCVDDHLRSVLDGTWKPKEGGGAL